MEKYCKSCGRVFDDINYKLCPFCGSKLDTRYGRQPIPRQLRHEVFKRYGYRCCECGASKNETSLEIDHILPVAKGGTNDIDNLQTLCRECNRMKHTDEWVGGENTLEVSVNELNSIKKIIQRLNEELEKTTNEDEKFEIKFKIIKLNEEISILENKIEKLRIEQENNIKEHAEQIRKKKLFKKVYVLLEDDILIFSKFHSLPFSNKNDIVNYLVNEYSEEQILDMINELNETRSKIIKEINDSGYDNNLLFNNIAVLEDVNESESDEYKIDYIICNYSGDLNTLIKNTEDKLDIRVGDIVEPTSGPLKGEKTEVVTVSKSHGEVSVRLMKSDLCIPVYLKFNQIKKYEEKQPSQKTIIYIGSIVEPTSGPFKGDKARIIRIDESCQEVMIELLEGTEPILLTLKINQIKKYEEKQYPKINIPIGSIVEVISGEFKGEKAKVISIHPKTDKVNIEFIDESLTTIKYTQIKKID